MNDLFPFQDIPKDLMAPETFELMVNYALRVISALIILIAGWIIGSTAQSRVNRIPKLDKTLGSFLGGFVKYIILAVAIVTVLGQFGVQTASFLAVLGAAGLAIGLALQGTLSNVAAGMMLLLLRPFNVGDYITYGSNQGGTVKSLSLFGTELATADNVYIYAPNSTIWNSTIMNYSRNTKRRHDFAVGISYGDSIDTAFDVLNKVLSAEKRLLQDDGKKPQIMVDTMGDSAVNLKIRIWCLSSDYWDLKWDMTKAFKEALDEAGITIPFPSRTLEIVSKDAEKLAKPVAKKSTPQKSTAKKSTTKKSPAKK